MRMAGRNSFARQPQFTPTPAATGTVPGLASLSGCLEAFRGLLGSMGNSSKSTAAASDAVGVRLLAMRVDGGW